MEDKFESRICLGGDASQSDILEVLRRAFPVMEWSEGDSSWDKIRVSGKSPSASIRVFRYESPGPFSLTITVQSPDPGQVFLSLRDRVLGALHATVWKPLEPQPVELVKIGDGFPASYNFDCEREIEGIQDILQDAQFWYWEPAIDPVLGYHMEGRIHFRRDGKIDWTCRERVRISGSPPRYRVDVGHWPDQPGRTPSCDDAHQRVQDTILPVIGAHNVTPAL